MTTAAEVYQALQARCEKEGITHARAMWLCGKRPMFLVRWDGVGDKDLRYDQQKVARQMLKWLQDDDAWKQRASEMKDAYRIRALKYYGTKQKPVDPKKIREKNKAKGRARKCLKCHKSFFSVGKIFMCKECKQKDEWRLGLGDG